MRRACVAPTLLLVASLALISAPTASASSTHRNYPLGHAKSCRPGYHKVNREHWVTVRGKHKKVHYVECEYRPQVPRSATPAPTPAAAPAYAYAVELDPTFTQGASPLDVTYSFSASATVNGQPDPSLPQGILDLYSDGLLACSLNVGGSVDGGTCSVDYAALGDHQVITEYIPNGVNSVTETYSENIEAFPTTLDLGAASVGAETIESDHNWAVTLSIPVSIDSQGSNPGGTVTMVGGACTAIVSGSSTCSVTEEQSTSGATSFDAEVSYSGNTEYSGSSASGSVTVPEAPAPEEIDDPTTTGVSFTESGIPDGYTELIATVSPYPSDGSVLGSVVFSWTAEDGAETCDATGTGNGGFECVAQNETLYQSAGGDTTVTATYTGGSQAQGDAVVTTYEDSSGQGSFT